MKRIMSEKKTTLPSLRNQNWKTFNAEICKINYLLTNILKNNTEFNDLICAGAKSVCEKNRLFPEEHKKSKPALETQIKNLQ